MATSGMTRKDYELVASAIAESDVLEGADRRAFALDMADRLLATSDAFDPVRFANTCLPEGSWALTADEVAAWTHGLGLRVKSLSARRNQPSRSA